MQPHNFPRETRAHSSPMRTQDKSEQQKKLYSRNFVRGKTVVFFLFSRKIHKFNMHLVGNGCRPGRTNFRMDGTVRSQKTGQFRLKFIIINRLMNECVDCELWKKFKVFSFAHKKNFAQKCNWTFPQCRATFSWFSRKSLHRNDAIGRRDSGNHWGHLERNTVSMKSKGNPIVLFNQTEDAEKELWILFAILF